MPIWPAGNLDRCQRDLDSVLARDGRPVQQRGTATYARYGCPGQASAHALGLHR